MLCCDEMIAQTNGGATMPADVQCGIASRRLRLVLLLHLQLLRCQWTAATHAAVQAVCAVAQANHVETLFRGACKGEGKIKVLVLQYLHDKKEIKWLGVVCFLTLLCRVLFLPVIIRREGLM